MIFPGIPQLPILLLVHIIFHEQSLDTKLTSLLYPVFLDQTKSNTITLTKHEHVTPKHGPSLADCNAHFCALKDSESLAPYQYFVVIVEARPLLGKAQTY